MKVVWTAVCIVFMLSVHSAILDPQSTFTMKDAVLDPLGPFITQEPPNHVDYSNSTGINLDCISNGNPKPSIHWIYNNGTKVYNVSNLRYVLPNGTLKFLAFKSEEYWQDVHATIYRCVAYNILGTVISREVRVRAVVTQYYEIQVYDEFVIKGSVAVMKCQIPSFVQDYVQVTKWVRESADGKTLLILKSGGRFTLFSTGVLHIEEIGKSDYNSSYKCHTRNILTNEIKSSTSAGRVIISEPTSGLAPRVVHSRSHVEILIGQRVELPCNAQGFPLPLYNWSRLRLNLLVPLDWDDRIYQISGTLTIRDVTIDDGGTYVCLVKNVVGNERVDTILTVIAPISVFITPDKQVIDEGKPASFSCGVSGSPIVFISWIKDGEHLVMNDRVKLISRDVLHFDVVKREDQGMYQCLVRNERSSAQAAAQLTIGDASPIFTHTFSEQAVQPGRAISLQCAASGSPIPRVSWTLDGENVPTSDRFHLRDFVSLRGDVVSYVNISKIMTEDGGEYRCVVQNRNGRIEHSARINVFGAPFIKAMNNVSTIGGNDLMIHCPVGGYPIDNIRWEHDGVALPINHRQKVFTNGTLFIQDVQGNSDKGIYTCNAVSNQGEARRNVYVAILNAPVINPFAFPRNVRQGVRAGIQCLVIEGDRPVIISWLKDEKIIPPGIGIIVRKLDEFTSSLVIDNISGDHNGNYTCVARNLVAQVKFTASLVVNVPPKWLFEPEDSSVVVGNSLQLDCKVDGFPTPVVIWKKASGKLPQDYQIVSQLNLNASVLKNGSLVIRNVQEEHGGYYLCQASNDVGPKLSKVVYVKVHVPAQVNKVSINQTVIQGNSLTLICQVKGDSSITVTWKHQLNKIDLNINHRFKIQERITHEGLDSQLVISNVDRKDGGQYLCQASNQFGRDEKKLRVYIKEVPEAPKRIKVLETGSRHVKLTWTPAFDGNDDVTRFIIQFKLETDSWHPRMQNFTIARYELSAEVSGLRPATKYQFRVIAQNNVGLSDPSSSVITTTSEEAPSGPPSEIHIEPLSPTSLSVRWKSPLLEHQNGDIRGYRVSYREIDGGTTVTKTVDENMANLQLILTNLKKFTQYEVVILAFNRMGNGPNSTPVVATTQEDVPSKPPMDVQCSTLSSQSIYVKWRALERTSIHGTLKGYKIVYFPTELPTEQKTLTIISLHVDLVQLRQYSNYSIRVAAFTRAGQGKWSSQVYCKTHEGVPGIPADIKALVMSADSIMISWRVPQLANGILKSYNIYVKDLSRIDKLPMMHSVPAGQTHFEVRGLKEDYQYQFFVTASTNVGEGQKSRTVSLSPVSTVPARIATFPDKFEFDKRDDVLLPCRSVGIPTPDREWRVRNEKVEENARIFSISDGLMIKNVRVKDSANYTCKVANIYSTDEITHELKVNDAVDDNSPPSPPEVSITSQTSSSININWRITDDGGAEVTRITLHLRQNEEKWSQSHLQSSDNSFILNNLQCGTHYDMYMTAENQFGVSKPSDIISTNTLGIELDIPDRDQFLHVNSTFIMLDLRSWSNEACPVLYFVVEYRKRDNTEWMTISKDLTTHKNNFLIDGLSSGVWYNLRVTAFTNSGSSTAEYEFITLSESYENHHPESSLNLQSTTSFFLSVVIPAVLLTFLIIALPLIICYLRGINRRKNASERVRETRTTEDCKKEELISPTIFSGYSSTTKTPYFTNDPLCKEGGSHVGVIPYATTHLSTEDRANIQLKTFTPCPFKKENLTHQQAGILETSKFSKLIFYPTREEVNDCEIPQNEGISLDTLNFLSYVEPSAPEEDYGNSLNYPFLSRQKNQVPTELFLRQSIPDLLNDDQNSNSSTSCQSINSQSNLPHRKTKEICRVSEQR